MILETGILLHAIAFPHIFGFFPIYSNSSGEISDAAKVAKAACTH